MPNLITSVKSSLCTIAAIVVAAALGVPAAGTGAQTILFVNAAAPSGGDGSSWGEALDDLQAALGIARLPGSSVEQIWIAAGTYRPWTRCSSTPQAIPGSLATFEMIGGVDLYGGFAGFENHPSQRDIAANVTVLSGDLTVPQPSDCCTPHAAPGCSCGPCESIVCHYIPSCCDVTWDAMCVSMASFLCPALCQPIDLNSARTVRAVNLAAPVIFDGVTLSGGALLMQINQAAIELRQCAVTGGSGSRIEMASSSLTVHDCSFEVHATPMTGSYIVAQNSIITVSHSTFIGITNGATWRGGAIDALNSVMNINHCTFQDLFAHSGGGALYMEGGNLSVSACRFENLRAERGGAIAVLSGSMSVLDCEFIGNRAVDSFFGGGAIFWNGENTTCVVERCVFHSNQATASGSSSTSASGGGLRISGIDIACVIRDCDFTNNFARNSGGAASITGSFVNLLVERCTFTANHADWTAHAGALYLRAGGPLEVNDCVFIGNTANNGGAVGSEYADGLVYNRCTFIGNVALLGGGAAIAWINSRPAFVNCFFNANSAYEGGALTAWYRAEPKVINCTFAGNTAERGGAILARDFPYGFTGQPAAIVHIRNSILFGNIDITGVPANGQIVLMENASAHVRSSCVDTGGGLPWPGPGNISNNPLFIDPIGPDGVPGTGDEDYRLALQSPCIDAGENNAAIPYGPLDLDQLPRFVDVAAMPDTGCGAAPLVDLGAYEVQAIPPGKGLPPRLGDLNGDGMIGPADLGILLGQWGMAADCLIADLNGDNNIGPGDLGILLGNWDIAG